MQPRVVSRVLNAYVYAMLLPSLLDCSRQRLQAVLLAAVCSL